MTDDKKERQRAYQRAYQRYKRSGDRSHMDRFFGEWGIKAVGRNIPGHGRMRADWVGKTFGNWTVVEDTRKTTDSGQSIWLCHNKKTGGTTELSSKSLYQLKYQARLKSKARTKAVGISIVHHKRLSAIKSKAGKTASEIIEGYIDAEFSKL